MDRCCCLYAVAGPLMTDAMVFSNDESDPPVWITSGTAGLQDTLQRISTGVKFQDNWVRSPCACVYTLVYGLQRTSVAA